MKRYIFGLNVNSSEELPEASLHIKEFIKNLGKAEEMEIQVSINPLLVEHGATANAIGFRPDEIMHYEEECEDDYYEEDDGFEPEESIGFKTK